MNKRAKRRLRGKLRSLKVTRIKFTLKRVTNLIYSMQSQGIKGPYRLEIGGKQFNFN